MTWRTNRGQTFRICRVISPAALILCVSLLHPGAAAQRPRGPLSKAEVIELLNSGATPARVATLARQFGISFELTPETKNELSGAGGTPELLKALGEVAPKPPPPPVYASLLIEATPAGAEVYIDGKLVGKTGTDGQLKVPELPTGQHTVLLKLPGYREEPESVNLVAGDIKSFTKSLVAVKPAAASPAPGPGRATTPASFRVAHQHAPFGTCEGQLIIGNGRVQFQADNGKHSFDSPLNSIEWGTPSLGGGFLIRPADGKKYFFHSRSTPEVLQTLQQATGKH